MSSCPPYCTAHPWCTDAAPQSYAVLGPSVWHSARSTPPICHTPRARTECSTFRAAKVKTFFKIGCFKKNLILIYSPVESVFYAGVFTEYSIF